jgi:preprotein translocase subunit Sec61beta
VIGTSVFEVAAAGLVRMREEGWIGPLTPTAVVRVEVQVALVVHDVPLKALERWAN